MFWGLTIEAGRKYSQTVEQPFQVTMAALEIGPQIDEKSLVQVMLTYDNSDYLLCTLSRNSFNQPLDLSFGRGEIVVFSLNGTGTVHLTGYNVPEQEEFADDYDDGDVDSDLQYDSEEVPELEVADSEDDDEEDSDWEPSLTGKKRKAIESKAHLAKKMRIKELNDDEEEEDFEGEEEESEYDSSFIDDSAINEEEDEDIVTESLDSSDQKTPPGKKKKKKSKDDTQNKENKLTKDENKGVKPAENGAGDGEGEKKKKKKKKKKKNKDTAEKNQTVQQQEQQSGNGDGSKTGTDAASQEAQAKVGKPRKLAGGVIVEDLTVGHGPVAKPGRMVSVHYVGKLVKNNKQFDSNLKGKPLRFCLGKGEVIKGWDTGLIDMKCGGKRKIIVPSSQAYGNKRSGPIPAGSDLYFEVQLRSVG